MQTTTMPILSCFVFTYVRMHYATYIQTVYQRRSMTLDTQSEILHSRMREFSRNVCTDTNKCLKFRVKLFFNKKCMIAYYICLSFIYLSNLLNWFNDS